MKYQESSFDIPSGAAVIGKLSGQLQFQVVENDDGFHNLRPVWTELHQQADQFPEHTFLRAAAAWETVGRPRGRKLHIVVGRVAGEPVLIFPMTVQRIGPFTIGRALGPEFYEPCDVLVRSSPLADKWVQEAWDFVLSRFDLVRFPAIRASARLWPCLNRSRKTRFDAISSLFIDTSAWSGWEDYYRSRSANFRKDHKNSLKRLQQAGTLHWIHVTEPDRLAKTLAWMFAHKLDWLERSGGDVSLGQYKTFYARLCRSALEAGELVLIELLVNNVRVAAQIGFRAGARLDCDMIAWDPAWKECGPGRALDVHTVQWAFENSVRFIELGVFGHPSKFRFTDQTIDTAFNVFVACGARGRALLRGKELFDGVRSRLAKVGRKSST
jgi:CelD/BcsL family acetyltransferase involved in cellulose biosynthesis